MKISKEEVKSQSQVIAIAEVPEYETLQEAIAALGEAKVLSLVNTQNGTNIKNELRAGFASKPSKASMIDRALTELAQSEDLNLIRSTLSDPTAKEAYMAKKVAEYEAEFEARKAARAKELAAELEKKDGSTEGGNGN